MICPFCEHPEHRVVESRVADSLGFLPESVSVTSVADSDYLDFTAVSDNADEAALWANTWANAYVETKQADAADSQCDMQIGIDHRRKCEQIQRAEMRWKFQADFPLD